MLPTSPRLAARSISSSCTTPEAVMATRVSRGVTLTSTSSTMGTTGSGESSLAAGSEVLQHARGLVQRQPHHAGVAAAQLGDEARGAPLDRIGAGLVVGLAGADVVLDLLRRQLAEAHFRARQRAVEALAVGERDRGQHLVAAAGELREHGGGIGAI